MTSKSSLRHEILNDLLKEYRSPEMGIAIRQIYDFYEDHKHDLVTPYVEEFNRKKYSVKHIHYQRRIVSVYYQQIASLVEKDRSLKRLVYSVWSQGDLQIIPDILIPIETKALPKCRGNPPITDEGKYPKPFKRMLKLYRNAPI